MIRATSSQRYVGRYFLFFKNLCLVNYGTKEIL